MELKGILNRRIRWRFSFLQRILLVVIGALIIIIIIFARVLTSHGQTTTKGSSSTSASFRSDQLGISFTYAPHLGTVTIGTKVVGNTVYVYDTSQSYTSGQYVQVLSKDPQDSLEQAITKQILVGYNSAKCPMIVDSSNGRVYPSSYETAGIDYQLNDTATNDGGWPSIPLTNCPQEYTRVPDSGIKYFLADLNHPSKLLFISIGLSGISASSDLTSHKLWQDTIQFL